MTAWPGQMVRVGLSIGTNCQTWSPRGVRQRGGDRQERRSHGEPEQRPAACLVAAPRAGETHSHKIKMTFLGSHMHLHVLNCKEGSTLDVPPYLRIYAVMMKMFETFLLLLCSDKLLLCCLLTSAHACVLVQNRFLLLSYFLWLLVFPIHLFSLSHLCNLIFYSHFSTPSSINLQFFLPSQLFFPSIPRFWLHPSNYSSSPLYPWMSNMLSFSSPSHSFLVSVFKIQEISPQALSICCLFFSPLSFPKLQLIPPLPPPSSLNFFWLIAP